jgi:hypothetical protein
MNILTILIDAGTLLICALAVSSCGVDTGALPIPELTPAPAEEPIVVPLAVATPTATPTLSLTYVTYYAKSHTVTPNGGQPTKHYTATGYCAVVNAKTFCWDDGIHTIDYPGFPPVTGYYTYWGLACNGTCTTDVASSPVQTDLTFTNQIMTGVSISGVLGGAPTTVACSDDGAGTLDCGSFIIDTNQGAF